MDKFFLEDLYQLTEEISVDQLNQLFQELLEQLQVYLELDFITIKVKISVNNEQKPDINVFKNGFLDFGVIRNNGDLLLIELFNTYNKYWPFILLREAYYYFIPNALKKIELVKIVINQIVINDLGDYKTINKWIQIFQENLVNSDFLIAQLDRLGEFFRLKGTVDPTIFFYEYIRNNVLLIQDKKESFYDELFKEYLFRTSKSLYNDEIIETIRILIKIFYKVKIFRSLENYKSYFTEFKKDGYIQTTLSLRKFVDNIRWLNKFSFFAPSYDIDTGALGISTISCVINFNPLLGREEIDFIIKNLPFFYQSMSSQKNFSIEIFGWFLIPRVYENDLKRFLNSLTQKGFITNKNCFQFHIKANRLNLNYFRGFHNRKKLINPQVRQFKNEYNVKFEIEYSKITKKLHLSVLDYLVIDRIRNWSITGFSLEKRIKAVKLLKNDFFNENLNQQAMNKFRKKIFLEIQQNEELRDELVSFIKKNERFGFFYIRDLLNTLISGLELLENIFKENNSITNVKEFEEYIYSNGVSFSIEENLLFFRNDIYNRILEDYLPIFFIKKRKYVREKEKLINFANYFKVCNDLKIFNMDSLKDLVINDDLANSLHAIKVNRVKRIYKNSNIQNLKRKDIERILHFFLKEDPPIIKPIMISTISVGHFAKYYLQILLKKSDKAFKTIEEIKEYFPRLLYSYGKDLFNKRELLKVHIWLPNLRKNEKKRLISILYSLFGNEMISINRYFFDGLFPAYSRKDFYDFEKKEFLHTRDLFEQSLIHIIKRIQKELPISHDKNNNLPELFWDLENDLNKLTKQVEKRISYQHDNYAIKYFKDLLNLHLDLKKILIDADRFKKIRELHFFKKYIKSIKFKPTFQKFGLSQYYLYIRPFDLKDINFKLLLNNNFQKIKYTASIDNNQFLFIKYICPNLNPNKTYLNWITKSKKNIGEYCLFFIKKVYQIFHFDYNLSSKGWILNANRFKSYLQKILYVTNFKSQKLYVKQHNFEKLSDSTIYDINSREFQDLIQIYNWCSTDIKSILGTRTKHRINSIINLLEKELLFPYIKIKNLGIQEVIYIILPNIKEDVIDKLVKIFSFFNFGFLYEIEGTFFIKELQKDVEFENGLLIKLYFPDIELSSFYRLFDQLFQFLKVQKYIFLNDMVSGITLVKSIFGDLDFLKTYNPLLNLQYNEKDKKFSNNKLFTENFKPKYPDLI